MLEQFFKSPRHPACLISGPGGVSLNSFARYLSESGYARDPGSRHVRSAAHLVYWANVNGMTAADIIETTLSRFASHLNDCQCPGFVGMNRDRLLRGARAFVSYQEGRPLAATSTHRHNDAPSALWKPFCQWMQQQRGTSERTLRDYRDLLNSLLVDVGEDTHKLNVTYLRQYIVEQGRTRGQARSKSATSALRMFIRFLIAQGKCAANLDAAIPSLAYWRLSSLPRYLQPEEVERVIASPNVETPVGKRDRAILLLLSRLGLRANDVWQLRLIDIDWHAATIRVCGKNKRQTQLPLTQEVGQAIADYLQHGRPRTDSEYLFVRAMAPFRQFRDTRAICDLAKLAMCRAHVNGPDRGAAHVLRHSAATSMLRQGASLQDISVILRHQSIASTQIYAKVDTMALYEIAQPWPGDLPC